MVLVVFLEMFRRGWFIGVFGVLCYEDIFFFELDFGVEVFLVFYRCFGVCLGV